MLLTESLRHAIMVLMIRKVIIGVVFVSALLVFAPVVFSAPNAMGNQKVGSQADEAVRNSIQATKEAALQNREETKAEVKQRWQELKEVREVKKQEMQNKAAEKKVAIQARIKDMKDGKKKQIAVRIQERLSAINTARTEHFTKFLERLSTVLDKIESRTEKAKAAGKNVSSIETAITEARIAIASSQAMVDAQKAKGYQLVVTDDTTAKTEVGATVKKLQEDLGAVRASLKTAQTAVQKVFGQLKSIQGIDEVSTVTSAASAAASQ
ncbi:hypothetical protein KKB64_00465 [Patescibacteria group bacterium]|nr:hypothetical protein [Patescibacteria group bacterium]MBU1472246.1 hypothetical protein [Patescibacteria group bacterium]